MMEGIILDRGGGVNEGRVFLNIYVYLEVLKESIVHIELYE